jgi:hypothetical protein
MAYQPGIFQYGTIGADGFGIGYDDYGFGTDQIYTLPPFKVNENTGNDGTGLNNTFIDPDLGSLYGAGLTGGNIFTGGTGAGGGGAGGFQAPTDDGGYKDPVNIAAYKAGLIGPQGYASGRSEYQPINPPGPVVLPKVEVPIGQQGEVGPGGYTDAVNQSLFTQGLIGPAGYSSGTGPSIDPINPPDTVVLPPVEVTGTKIDTGLDSAAALSLLNSIGSGVVAAGETPSSGIVTLAPVVVPGSRVPNNGIDPAAILRLIQQGNINPVDGVTGEIVTIAPVVVTPGPTVTNPIVTNTIVTMPPVIVTPGPTVRITVPNPSLPPVTVSNFSPNVTYPPITSSLVPTTTAPRSTVPASVSPSVPFDPNTVNSGVGTYGTNAQTLTTKRDFGKELAESLAALKANQSSIMGMYGDLYKQFMPKGITDTESSIIDQYKTDLSR